MSVGLYNEPEGAFLTYKNRAVDVRQVAAELGVRYVLEGSVRRASRRVRIAGWFIMFAVEPEAAIPVFERALRLRPSDPQANFLLNGMAMSYLVLGQPEEAFDCASKAVALERR